MRRGAEDQSRVGPAGSPARPPLPRRPTVSANDGQTPPDQPGPEDRRGERGAGQGAGEAARHGREPAAERYAEIEPDPRFTLANERTMLAWQRSCVALLAAALAVIQLATVVPRPLRVAISVLLVILGLVLSVSGYLVWQERERRLRQGQPLKPHPVLVVLPMGLLVLAALVGVAVLIVPS